MAGIGICPSVIPLIKEKKPSLGNPSLSGCLCSKASPTMMSIGYKQVLWTHAFSKGTRTFDGLLYIVWERDQFFLPFRTNIWLSVMKVIVLLWTGYGMRPCKRKQPRQGQRETWGQGPFEHLSLITTGTRPSLKFMSRDIMSFLLKQCGVCYLWPCTHWMKYSQDSHHLSMTEESSCMHNWPKNYFKQTVWETYTITRSRITE